MNDKLIRITPDGSFSLIDNSYEGIRNAIGGSFDFVYAHATLGAYIEDEGLLTGSRFNCVASLGLQRAVFGVVVITRGDTDDEGNTVAPDDRLVEFFRINANVWQNVVASAEDIGQDIMPAANEATVPGPTIIGFDNQEDFLRAIGRLP
jgi:hypothetical protein